MHIEPHEVAVVGGGAGGLSAALVLGRARRRVIVVDAGAPRSDDRLRAVALAEGRTVAPAALFVRAALSAHPRGPAAALGRELAGDGLVQVDASGRAGVAGVRAAGNATNPRVRVITAA